MVSFDDIIILMGRHKKTYEAIFKDPVLSGILWSDIEGLLLAELSEDRGSRVRIVLRGVRAVFHRPHPAKETDRGAVRSMRRFLQEVGVRHDEL